MPKTSTKSTKTNSYDVARDLVLGPALIFHLDSATGQEVRSAGEGVQSFGIALRSIVGEDGTRSPARISIHGAFVAKASTGRARLQRWIVGADGKCSLGDPGEGAVCLGSACGRLDPHIAGVVFTKAAAYSARVAAALAKSRKAA